MLLFLVLIIPSGVATSLPEILIVRFFGAVAGSCTIANSPGSVSDIVSDEYRALAFSIWSIGPLNGPAFGPIIGGFATQWVECICPEKTEKIETDVNADTWGGDGPTG